MSIWLLLLQFLQPPISRGQGQSTWHYVDAGLYVDSRIKLLERCDSEQNKGARKGSGRFCVSKENLSGMQYGLAESVANHKMQDEKELLQLIIATESSDAV